MGINRLRFTIFFYLFFFSVFYTLLCYSFFSARFGSLFFAVKNYPTTMRSFVVFVAFSQVATNVEAATSHPADNGGYAPGSSPPSSSPAGAGTPPSPEGAPPSPSADATSPTSKSPGGGANGGAPPAPSGSPATPS